MDEFQPYINLELVVQNYPEKSLTEVFELLLTFPAINYIIIYNLETLRKCMDGFRKFVRNCTTLKEIKITWGEGIFECLSCLSNNQSMSISVYEEIEEQTEERNKFNSMSKENGQRLCDILLNINLCHFNYQIGREFPFSEFLASSTCQSLEVYEVAKLHSHQVRTYNNSLQSKHNATMNVERIAAGLRKNTTLTSLEIISTTIDARYEQLFRALEENTCLTKLNFQVPPCRKLRNSEINPNVVKSALEENKTLKIFSISSKVGIGLDSLILGVVKALSDSNLKKLHLQKAGGLGMSAVDALCEALEKNSALESLEISISRTEYLEKICNCILNVQQLKKLSFYGSATIFSEQVANSIKKNEHLKSLTLAPFGTGTRAYLKFLPPNLEKLSYSEATGWWYSVSCPEKVLDFMSNVLEVPSLKKMPLYVSGDVAILELLKNFHKFPPMHFEIKLMDVHHSSTLLDIAKFPNSSLQMTMLEVATGEVIDEEQILLLLCKVFAANPHLQSFVLREIEKHLYDSCFAQLEEIFAANFTILDIFLSPSEFSADTKTFQWIANRNAFYKKAKIQINQAN